MINIPTALLSKYNSILTKKSVPVSVHNNYKKWLRYYLDFCHKYCHGYADREVPVSMKRDKILCSECVSGAVTEEEFFHITKKIGFYGVEIINRSLYKEVEGFKFYSVTARGYKYMKSPECKYTGQYAIYKGPFSSISDDDDHTYPMGIPIEICTDTAWKLSNPPYKGMFLISNLQNTDVKIACGPKCC